MLNQKILLVEENSEDVRLICEMFKEIKHFRMDVTKAETLQQAKDILVTQHFDVILLDLSLPDSSGKETFDSMIQYSVTTPLVLITGLDDSNFVLQMINEGAQDYLNKALLSPSLLEKTILYSIERNNLRQALLREMEEKENAYRLLTKSEERYKTLFETNPHPMWVYDLETLRFLDVNDTAITKYGYTREEFLNMTILDIRPEEDIDLLMLHLEEGKTKQIEITEGWRHRLKNGIIIDVEITSHSVTYGRKKGRLILAHDITEKKRSQELLVESEKRFRSVVEEAAEIIYTIDAKGFFTYVNPIGMKLTGYSLEELKRMRYSDLTFPEYRTRITQYYLRQWINRELQTTTEYPIRTKSGEIKWFNQNVRLIIENDEPKGFYAISRDVTERKKIEVELNKNELKMKNIVENSTNVFYTHDTKHTLQFISPQIKKLLGYEVNEVLINWLELTTDNPINEIGFQKTINAIETGIAPQPYELELKHKNGKSVWVEVRESPIVENGKTVAIVGSLNDITDRKQADEKLRKSEERLRLSLKSSRQGLFDLNIQTGEAIVNDEYVIMLGYDPKTFVETNAFWIERLHPNDKEQTAQVYKDYVSGKLDEYRVEFRQRTATGEWKWILSTGKIVDFTEDGKPLRMLGIHTDIDEFKKAEEQLLLQTSALDSAANTIVITDLTGKIVWVNKAFETNSGYSIQEAVGSKPNLLKSGIHNKEFYEELWNTINSGKIWRGSITNKRKNGTLYEENTTITPIVNRENIITHFVAVKEDVTERKMIESQLLRAQRMESLGTLAGGIAHDLNNVLAPIMLAMQYLRKTYVNESTDKMLNTIESSVKRGSDIVKQILGFARGMESKKIVLQTRHLVTEITGVFKETFPRSITIKNDIERSTWTIFGDPTHFHQLVMNLGVNARDAMPNGGTLTIGAENVVIDEQYARMNINAKPGRYVKFLVADTGTGMTREILEHIFEPFFTTKEIGKGTGLGLSTVHSIVKSHNGFIEVKTEVGKGTTFFIYLPTSDSAEIPNTENEVQESLLGNGELILVVDDEMSIREVTKQTLELSNYKVITASEGADAIGKFVERKSEIALILTDMMMPVMDGSQLILAARKISPTIKIIASSGLIDRQLAEDKSKFELNGYIEKPYTAENLLHVVKKVLSDN